MDKKQNELVPRARTAGLIVRELAGELLVYDRDRNKAHCLNQTAALIWRQCDGQTTIGEMCAVLNKQAASPIDEQVIWYALDQFAKDHLLKHGLTRPAGVRKVSRRELIQRIGVAASLPLVASVFAPNVFAAASCTQGCIGPNDCTVPGCTNGCVSNVCQPN